jgi:hypothetical protein
MSVYDISTGDLLAKLTPAARRRYLDAMLGRDFAGFVRKVFETVSPGDVFLPNQIPFVQPIIVSTPRTYFGDISPHF